MPYSSRRGVQDLPLDPNMPPSKRHASRSGSVPGVITQTAHRPTPFGGGPTQSDGSPPTTAPGGRAGGGVGRTAAAGVGGRGNAAEGGGSVRLSASRQATPTASALMS